MQKGERIVIEKGKERADHWVFLVQVGSRGYEVTVDKPYLEKLTQGSITARDLVMNSFLFLLEREPADAILRSFNLQEIPNYFPEYEASMEFLIQR